MLVEIGPRTIGQCNLQLTDCTGKTVSIVKKVLLATDGKTAWACQNCLLRKLQKDRIETMRNPNPAKMSNL